MAGRKSSIGPTGEAVRANIIRIREGQNLSYAEVTRRLTEAGRAIPELGLRNIERGQRKVDVDELVALAQVLGVAPITLLMPYTEQSTDSVHLTGSRGVTSARLWEWLTAETPLGGHPETSAELWEWLMRCRPLWQIESLLSDLRHENPSDYGDD
ncbi:hypothetical protein CFL01nite_11760 [Corynebacterium flavescens]|uniref:HTH cro/C1-type domain-containing protein n=2 Tax=Corynebacterium flavescens TaxID=28028 RepID=A0AB73B7J9_CORFL|nr:hypothetical protein CFL01nite_11760 [Corynebacterium flavescens]